MKLTILQENLLSSLSKVIRVIDTRANLPVLTNFLFEAKSNLLNVIGSNLENSIKVQMGVKVEAEGSVAVSAHTFYNYLSLLSPGKITLKLKDNNLLVEANSQRASFPTQDAKDFPTLPSLEKEPVGKINNAKLKKLIRKTSFAVASDTARLVLTGVLLKANRAEVIVVGTDGFRLAECKDELTNGVKGESFQAVIPARGLIELERLLGVSEEEVVFFRSVDKNQIAFMLPQLGLYSRLIDSEYPDYEKIVPNQTPIEIEVNKDSLLPAVKQVALFSKQDVQTVELTLSFSKKEITLRSQSSELGKAEGDVPIEVNEKNSSTKDETIGFNARFLVETLSHFDSDKILIKVKEPNAPVLFVSKEEPAFRQVIMPVRLKSSA